MSQTFGTGREPGVLTDREIAEDILTSQKYISNYYYAPAILESSNPNLRSTFERAHSNTQSQAKQVFDYLNAKGWYKPRQADAQAVNDLRNAAQQSKQVFSSITDTREISDTGGKSRVISGQNIYSPESTSSNLPGSGWQSQSQSQPYQTTSGWQSQPQPFQTGTGWQPTYSQTPQWTGTQAGEGQSGMGPSSLAQWARWGGQPSWMQSSSRPSGVYGSQGTGTQTTGYGGYGSYGAGTITGGWQSQPQSFQTGTGWQPTYSQTPQWTGTQAGEGQSGMGPSSLAQWARWGGQPSWMQSSSRPSGFYGSQGTGAQTTGYGGYGSYGAGAITGGWQSQPQPLQTGTGWQPTYSQTPQWTGTQAGEGQSGMGPSSLAQWARWGGQPSWMQPQLGTRSGQWG